MLRSVRPTVREGFRLCALVSGLAALGCTGSIAMGDREGAVAAGGAGGGIAGGGGRGGVGGSAGTPAACTTPSVDRAPLRRLTREEYDRTARDLVGAGGRPSSGLAEDERFGAFRSNLSAPVDGLLADQYMRSAETLAKAAVAKVSTLVPCDRAALGDAACAAKFIEAFGLRAYRRPLSTEERGRYETLYQKNATGGFAGGIEIVIRTMLQSPHFLYHVEESAGAANGATAPLAPYAVASRLSYFLWGTMPDAELFQAAAAGRLRTPEGVATEAARLLAHDRARDAMASLHLQWLGIDGIGDVVKDTKLFPEFQPALRDAMRDETIAFVDRVIRKEGGSLEALLTDGSTSARGALLTLYGGKDPGVADALVPLPTAQRAGLLTQAAFLATHAHPNQSSPVSRGVVVRKNLLCQPLPDPPANVNNTPPDPRPDATTRERFAMHEEDPSCGACHRLIDPIGFAFEGYDAIGKHRATENGRTIDTTGSLTGTEAIDGPIASAVDLARKLAGSDEVRSCVARQWLRFALGRMEGDADACAVAEVIASFRSSGWKIPALVAAIVGSDAFLRRTVTQ